MKSGQLRWPITIQQRVTTQSQTTGEVTYTWSDFAVVWADMSPISRRGSKSAWESVIAQQTVAQRVVQFDVRYIQGIDETMRIIDYDAVIWDIKSIVDVDTRHRELWIICERGLTQG